MVPDTNNNDTVIKISTPNKELEQMVCERCATYPDSVYRPSKYVLTLDTPDGLLLWNTLTLSLVLKENLTCAQWLSDAVPEKDTPDLKAMAFYVPESFDEDAMLKEITQDRALTQLSRTKFTILTTLFCNARCSYCYESHGRFLRTSMDTKTAEDVARFIIQNATPQPITLEWIGGEPLLNTRAIDIICTILLDHGIDFSSNLITNGSLIDENVLQSATGLWGLKSMQITLDGTEHNYNEIKSYNTSIDNPFRKVISNIDQVLKRDIRLSIRLNLSHDNLADLLLLIDYLTDRYPDKSKYLIYACLLEQETHSPDNTRLVENKRDWHAIMSKLWGLGFAQRRLEQQIPINKCIADNDNCHVISPSGELYRCEEIADEDKAGNIYTGITRPEIINKWKATNKDTKCLSCPINPVCYNLLHCMSDLECNDLTQYTDITSRQFAMLHELRKYKNIYGD